MQNLRLNSLCLHRVWRFGGQLQTSPGCKGGVTMAEERENKLRRMGSEGGTPRTIGGSGGGKTCELWINFTTPTYCTCTSYLPYLFPLSFVTSLFGEDLLACGPYSLENDRACGYDQGEAFFIYTNPKGWHHLSRKPIHMCPSFVDHHHHRHVGWGFVALT